MCLLAENAVILIFNSFVIFFSTVRKLKIDKALLSVTNQLPYPLMCTELSHNCYKVQ